ncbi:glycosyltransferase family 4 protein [Novosphingobium beihaiensis]|uniref:Glycosyltransferase family 4 protein n=1 Tax=Novosphingobium beihaiensis TaxID=2930389 RepID=A0ABT0BW32_9SPHN|nr:glycosyltransferase family 4 protein [Novosphingobium beihaiensis]MCJ2188849.1 glycosyltransferase family 4 protein [Novosphingobium beihaiensis]
MTQVRVLHLLDDFAMGGVSQAVSIYQTPELRETAHSQVLEVSPDSQLAPKLPEADIIVTHFPPRWKCLPFLLSLRLRNRQARLVHVEHSYTGSWEAHNVPSTKRFRLMMRAAFALFDEVVCVSHGQMRWLREAAALPAEKLRVIQPLSGHKGLGSVPAPDWQGERPLVVGAYGRFVQVKGFDRLIEAFRTLDPERYVLHLGGAGPEEAYLRQLAAGHANIQFKGMIDDVPAFLGECDVIAMPSRWEAYGLVATEAKMAARPILVAEVDGLPEQAGAAGRVIDFTRTSRFAEALSSLRPDHLRDMAAAARLSVSTVFEERIEAWRALFACASASRR